MIINVEDFDMMWFKCLPDEKRHAGNQGNKKKIVYKSIITAFDIETSYIKEIEQSIMYIWQWQFGDKCTVVGRTWDDFRLLCEKIGACINGRKLVVYVHNLSYEWQWLKGLYNFKPDEVFAVDSRKVLKCDMFGFLEFRCSYLHSNMSLKEYTSKMGAEHSKLSGKEFNYDIVRYPWTKLTDKELEYCVNDVLGLVEALTIEMEHDGDNLYTVPLTSTGYVRRDCKRSMGRVSHYFVPRQLPNLHVYEMLREAFRGGNTHCNRYVAGKVLHNVKSADRSSSYPDEQCNRKFPISAFFEAGACTLEELDDIINKREKAVVMRIRLWGVKLRNKYWGCPYLSRDKCRNIINGVFDNGRILSCDYCETTITDIDFHILLDEYDFNNMDAYDVCFARYGKLPQPLIKTITQYYTAKTTLKGVKEQELYYMKSKNKLNSIYGMSAQACKPEIQYINGEFVVPDNPDWESLLAKFNHRAFEPYQWGVWTTAWARYDLEQGIKLAHSDTATFVYCDTDSVKYLGDIDWTVYNKERIKASKKSGAHATDPKGEEHYMGVFEPDGVYCEFASLGAKKYVYRETPESKLKVTIAGVRKAEGGPELEKAGGITAFKTGFVFKDAGGTESVYNDVPPMRYYEKDGNIAEVLPNVVIKPSTYTLGITAEYMRLLEYSTLKLDS